MAAFILGLLAALLLGRTIRFALDRSDTGHKEDAESTAGRRRRSGRTLAAIKNFGPSLLVGLACVYTVIVAATLIALAYRSDCLLLIDGETVQRHADCTLALGIDRWLHEPLLIRALLGFFAGLLIDRRLNRARPEQHTDGPPGSTAEFLGSLVPSPNSVALGAVAVVALIFEPGANFLNRLTRVDAQIVAFDLKGNESKVQGSLLDEIGRAKGEISDLTKPFHRNIHNDAFLIRYLSEASPQNANFSGKDQAQLRALIESYRASAKFHERYIYPIATCLEEIYSDGHDLAHLQSMVRPTVARYGVLLTLIEELRQMQASRSPARYSRLAERVEEAATTFRNEEAALAKELGEWALPDSSSHCRPLTDRPPLHQHWPEDIDSWLAFSDAPYAYAVLARANRFVGNTDAMLKALHPLISEESGGRFSSNLYLLAAYADAAYFSQFESGEAVGAYRQLFSVLDELVGAVEQRIASGPGPEDLQGEPEYNVPNLTADEWIARAEGARDFLVISRKFIANSYASAVALASPSRKALRDAVELMNLHVTHLEHEVDENAAVFLSTEAILTAKAAVSTPKPDLTALRRALELAAESRTLYAKTLERMRSDDVEHQVLRAVQSEARQNEAYIRLISRELAALE